MFESISREWRKAVAEFRAKAREFMIVLSNLEREQYDVKRFPQLQSDYNDLIARSVIIRKTVSTVTAGIDKIISWVGLNGALGALPLVPIAVIGAAAAAMGKWLTDVYVFNKRLAEAKRLEASGMSPREAAETAIKMSPSIAASIGQNIFKPLVPLAIIGTIFFLTRQGK